MSAMLGRCLVTAVLVLSGAPVLAANHYIRAGAKGDGKGTDWTNAYPTIPASLQRGDTYYVADGDYGSHVFNDPLSGTLTITIKKATASDHGTAVGWDPSYGDGQAVLKSQLHFMQGYYVLDGQTRNEADWFAASAYGFRLDHNNQDGNIVIQNYGVPISDITIRYIYVDAIYQNLPSTTIRRYAVDTDGYDGGTTAKRLLFSRMCVRGSNNVWFLRTTEGAIVEYSGSDGAAGNGTNHGEIVNLYYSGSNAIIRYNIFKNAYLAGGGTALVAITYANGLQFYGNLAMDFGVGDGAVGFLGGDASHCRIFNNTFVRGLGAAGFASDGTDNLVQNNLWVGNKSVDLSGSHDYNAFSGASGNGEAHAQTNVPTSIFVNYAGNDLRLTSGTAAGTSLAAPYDVDLLGNPRGSDGAWDRGAFEHCSGGACATKPDGAAPKPDGASRLDATGPHQGDQRLAETSPSAGDAAQEKQGDAGAPGSLGGGGCGCATSGDSSGASTLGQLGLLLIGLLARRRLCRGARLGDLQVR